MLMDLTTKKKMKSQKYTAINIGHDKTEEKKRSG